MYILVLRQPEQILGLALGFRLMHNRPNNTGPRPQARSQGGGQGGQLTPPLRTKGPLENQRSAREIIKANNYKWLTIYLHQLLCTKPPTKWLQNLLSKGGSGGANL